MNKEDLMKLAKSQEGSLRIISKDMETLARMLNKTPAEEEEKYQANLIQGSFYITAYTMAAVAFNKAVEEKQIDPECSKDLIDYFSEELGKMKIKRDKKSEIEDAN